MKQDNDNGNGLGGNTEENTGLTESRKRSLANLKPAWPKGQSGNPSGRPRKPITEAYAEIAEQKYPDDPLGRTYAQLIAEGQCKAAIKGKTEAAREIREALEGKTPTVVGDDTASMSVTLNVEAVRKKLLATTNKLRQFCLSKTR